MSLPATFHLTVVNPGSTLVSTLSSFWTWGHSCLDCQMPLHMLYHRIPTWDGSWAQTTVGIAGSCVFWGSRLNTSALCKCRHLTVTSSYVAESDYNFILGKHWAAYTYNGCRVFYMVNKELCVPWILRMQFTLERCLYYLFDYLFIYLLTNGLLTFPKLASNSCSSCPLLCRWKYRTISGSFLYFMSMSKFTVLVGFSSVCKNTWEIINLVEEYLFSLIVSEVSVQDHLKMINNMVCVYIYYLSHGTVPHVKERTCFYQP